MVTKPAPKKTRGMPVVLPPWWLREVERQTVGMSLSELAAELTRLAKRSPAWDRTTVGKFLRNEHPTFELMEAFCLRFELPPPHFVARSYEEAMHLRREVRKYDEVNQRAERDRRREVVDAARGQLEASTLDQTRPLRSSDETGDVGRRRPRGMVRGRSTPS